MADFALMCPVYPKLAIKGVLYVQCWRNPLCWEDQKRRSHSMAFKIELKKVHVDTRMSEETNCYSAELHINGKKVGVVSNHGHGGCDNLHLDPKTDWTQEKI